MKKFFVPGFIAGVVLLLFSYLGPYLLVTLLPSVAEEYYNPIFGLEGDKTIMYFLHPFVISYALAWFWDRFKTLFHGSFWVRGIGWVFCLQRSWPPCLPCGSSSTPCRYHWPLLVSWFLYGLPGPIVAGLIYAKLNP